jgi:hypothetical protein
MANEDSQVNLNLERKILSNKGAKSKKDIYFHELTKSKIPINEEEFLSKYHNIFYKIPVGGKYSHKSLIDQSYEYVRTSYIKMIENKISEVLRTLNSKENELAVLEEPTLNNPPDQIYEDGAYLIAGENGAKYPGMDAVYIVQEGRKRVIHEPELYMQIRRSFGQPEDFSGKYYVTFTELNLIPDGPDIHTAADLHLRGSDLEIDLPDVLGVSAYVDVELRCEGNEISDYIPAITIPDTNYIQEMQFYLDNSACIIRYIDDEYVNDDFGPSVKETIIQKGETITIRLLRNSDTTTHNIPSDMEQFYEEGLNVNYNDNTFVNYIRQWGPGGIYNSVTYASGRIKSKQIEFPTHLNILQDNLNWEIFNGLPTEDTGIWEADPSITLINSSGYAGQEVSDYNTRMISKVSGRWGSLNQRTKLQNEVFNHPDNPYYKPTKGGTRRTCTIYGQPIIRWQKMYMVLMDAYSYTAAFGIIGREFEWLIVGASENDDFSVGSVVYTARKYTRDSIGLHMDYESNGYKIYGVKWNDFDGEDERIREKGYIGLQEYRTNELISGDDNYFNPNDGGSNYEYNG